MKKIFISYRRGGVKARTYRMADELKRRFGESNIFLDIDSIDPGERFEDVIANSIHQSSIVLIMIGPKWLTMKNQNGVRRLEDDKDHLRIEVETALKSNARVIPVLVDGAKMPSKSDLPDSISELSSLNAFPLSDSHWQYDVDQLLYKIEPKADKLSILAIISLVMSVISMLALEEIESTTTTITTAIMLSIIALILSIYAYKKNKPLSTVNKVMCITGMVMSSLLAIAWYDEYGDDEIVATPTEAIEAQPVIEVH